MKKTHTQKTNSSSSTLIRALWLLFVHNTVIRVPSMDTDRNTKSYQVAAKL